MVQIVCKFQISGYYLPVQYNQVKNKMQYKKHPFIALFAASASALATAAPIDMQEPEYSTNISSLSSTANATIEYVEHTGAVNMSELHGELQGHFSVGQLTTATSLDGSDENQPMLVANRDALLLLKPQQTDAKWIKVIGFNAGNKIGELQMEPPEQMLRSDWNNNDGRPRTEFSLKTWNKLLPAKWMKPGLSIKIKDSNGKVSHISATTFVFSTPQEMRINNISLGMLTPHRPYNLLNEDTAHLAADYFQKIPVAELTINNYLPITFEEVVLAGGRYYDERSYGEGGVHSGDLRTLAKTMAQGINLANFGVPYSKGVIVDTKKFFEQATIHKTMGLYQNGKVEQGMSGGNGIISLKSTIQNEHSHELGHHFKVGHYYGGAKYGSHQIYSGWGIDAFRDRMISNLRWNTAPETKYYKGDIPVEPFLNLYQYQNDAMSGGVKFGSVSKYSLHTPKTMRRIQEKFESLPMLNTESPTGYSIWDKETQQLISYTKKQNPVPVSTDTPVATLFGFYDPQGKKQSYIYPALYAGSGLVYELAEPESGDTCQLTIINTDGSERHVALASQILDNKDLKMNKFHVNIDLASQPVSASVSCAGQLLAERSYDVPNAELKPTLVIGGKNEYRQVVDQMKTFDQLDHLYAVYDVEGDRYKKKLKPVYRSISDVDADVAKIYGVSSISVYGVPDKNALAGEIFANSNKYTGGRDYFMSRHRGGYDSLPQNHSSTSRWKYLGSVDERMQYDINPLSWSISTDKLDYDSVVSSAYDQVMILDESVAGNTDKSGYLFSVANKDGAVDYYMQTLHGKGDPIPRNQKSNRKWKYLTSTNDINDIANGVYSKAEFDAMVAEWYDVDEIQDWNSSKKGVAGNIYFEDRDHSSSPITGGRDYYRLKKTTYGSFPYHEASNKSWEYLGYYLPKQ